MFLECRIFLEYGKNAHINMKNYYDISRIIINMVVMFDGAVPVVVVVVVFIN